MLRIDQLSYWEKKLYFEEIDFLIIGSGIVGLSTAIYLRERFKDAKILILERGYLPTGASTKNAGFACFGSPSELKDDLDNVPEDKVWETFSLRYHGLKRLFSIVDEKRIKYSPCGSWDLIQNNNNILDKGFLTYLNEKTHLLLGEANVYSEDPTSLKRFGFKGFSTAYKNRLEGSIHTDLLIQELFKKVISFDIRVIFGIEVNQLVANERNVHIETNSGELKANKVMICTNGFAKQFIQNEDIEPARAQVLVTKPISKLSVNGTFHIDKGYTYFRNVDNRILLGGGRNLTRETENTTSFDNTPKIQDFLKNLLKINILPETEVEVDYYWSGIMGIGNDKKPIIKKVNNNLYCGVRMGGMGVAIGAEVGYLLANQV
jgi:glycine/D-amino acid oxidase-like deaminating enzyme